MMVETSGMKYQGFADQVDQELEAINDTYGHAAGDKMLIELRDVLLGICRRSDFVIRWGGDEFVVLLPELAMEAEEAYRQITEQSRAFAYVVADFNKNDETLVNKGDLGWFNKGGFIAGIDNPRLFQHG